jgi:hypothetical protein
MPSTGHAITALFLAKSLFSTLCRVFFARLLTPLKPQAQLCPKRFDNLSDGVSNEEPSMMLLHGPPSGGPPASHLSTSARTMPGLAEANHVSEKTYIP